MGGVEREERGEGGCGGEVGVREEDFTGRGVSWGVGGGD